MKERKVRGAKKKIKDKNNLQIRGKAGQGKRRAKGREEKCRDRLKKFKQRHAEAAAAAAAAEGKVVEDETEANRPKGYVELARKQEERAQAEAAERETADAAAAAEGGKKKKKGKKRRAEAAEAAKKSEEQQAGKNRRRGGRSSAGNGRDSSPDVVAPPRFMAASAASAARGSEAFVDFDENDMPSEHPGRPGAASASSAARGAGSTAQKAKSGGKSAAALAPGDAVRLAGLQGAVELNGSLATLVSWDAAKHRWLTRLPSGAEKLLRPENLQKLASAQPALQPGTAVRLAGLKAAPGLNGKNAVCVSWDKAKERWLVRLADGGGEKLLKAENLEAAGATTPATPLLVVSAAVRQTVHICGEGEKPERLVRLFKAFRADEKRGSRDRQLALVLCAGPKAVRTAADALIRAQLPCVSLLPDMSKVVRADALLAFRPEGRRILVTTEDACPDPAAVRIGCVVSFDFPATLECYCQRLAKFAPADGAGKLEAHALIVDSRLKAPLAGELVALLERSGAEVDPKLRSLASAGDAGNSS
eukprot:TRINITY_DN26183_c0_g1_i1.p1 TRINITY_DN26183_c0_g1~~TRINITY_DN26183_c0_g1_i1.p1  ORF type:complete len:534 (+),score=137.19 TRINITY_DN26183_c0_g1_i1:59-1660(+)